MSIRSIGNWGRFGFCFVLAILIVGTTNNCANADFVEGFDSVINLRPPATDGVVVDGPGSYDWLGALRSSPMGVEGIFQGEPLVLPAHSGAPNSYLAMNYNSTGGSFWNPGTINTWLISPEQTFRNGDVISFYTVTPRPVFFQDSLELRLSTNGASVDVGTTAKDVGDFSTLLEHVNPNYDRSYPTTWTQYSVKVSGLSGPTNGRFAFRYSVEDAGPAGMNSNYIGIDTVSYQQAIPEPSSMFAVMIGVCGFGLTYRRRR